MSLVTNTGTTAEIVTLYDAAARLEVMLRQYKDGSALGGATHKPGRFTQAQIDAQITAVSAAITAVNT